MEISFDPAKNASDLAKHGIALAEASALEWGSMLVWPDVRRNYGEPRHCGIGYIDQRLYVVVYADRGTLRRIISLRKANRREVNRYAQA